MWKSKLNTDNIVAIATANGYSGIGIIRISGVGLFQLVEKLTKKKAPPPKVASYTDFFDHDGEIIDSGIILYFQAPHSFTGEDVIEIQGHGSPITLQMLLQSTIELGCRIATPGEFSRRAYLNGKIDLLQAESIIDLIHAESESSARGALKSLKGTFSKHIHEINQKLIDLRMFVEASLDFPEEDIEFIANAKIKDKLEKLQVDIKKLLASTKQGVLLGNGANIVIIGRPNVGKSSILNRLANEEIAIVTDIAGTTRDIIKEKIIINGIAFNVIDTAGIRETTDKVEQIGIERTLNSVNSANMCLVILDANFGVTQEDQNILEKIPVNIPRLYVHNKIDLINEIHSHQNKTYTTNDIPVRSGTQNTENKTQNIENNIDFHPRLDLESIISKADLKSNLEFKHVYISAKKDIGIDLLRNAILQIIGYDNNNHDIFIARHRHLERVTNSVSHIDNAFANWHNLELLAEELRYAHNSLTEITGEFTSDDLLGEIFSRFCIGK